MFGSLHGSRRPKQHLALLSNLNEDIKSNENLKTSTFDEKYLN